MSSYHNRSDREKGRRDPSDSYWMAAADRWMDEHSEMCLAYRVHHAQMVVLGSNITEEARKGHAEEFIRRVNKMKNDKIVAERLAYMEKQRVLAQAAANEGKISDEGDDEDDTEAGGGVADEVPDLSSEGIETDSGGDEASPVSYTHLTLPTN